VTDLINLSEDEYIKLSPNPFVGFLNLEFKLKNYQKLNVQVINVSNGNVVYSVNDIFSGTKLQLSNISAGIYVVRVKTNDAKNSYQFKMIKQ
jgi:curli biogenesis system outer membrane secretion channel CsgG